MASSRLPDHGTNDLIRKITQKTLECEPAISALERASAIVRAKDLSQPIIVRLLASNEEAASHTLRAIERGVSSSNPAQYQSIQEAVAKEGLAQVRHVALAINLRDYALNLINETGLDANGLIAPSLASAETAQWLTSSHIVDPSDAYCMALFADVGMFALVSALPEIYKALSKSDTIVRLTEFESDSLGVDHQQVGAAILSELKFPKKFVTFTSHHHSEPFDLTLDEKLVKVAMVAADIVSKAASLQTGLTEWSPLILDGAMKKQEDVPEIMEKTKRFLTQSNLIVPIDHADAA